GADPGLAGRWRQSSGDAHQSDHAVGCAVAAGVSGWPGSRFRTTGNLVASGPATYYVVADLCPDLAFATLGTDRPLTACRSLAEFLCPATACPLPVLTLTNT